MAHWKTLIGQTSAAPLSARPAAVSKMTTSDPSSEDTERFNAAANIMQRARLYTLAQGHIFQLEKMTFVR